MAAPAASAGMTSAAQLDWAVGCPVNDVTMKKSSDDTVEVACLPRASLSAEVDEERGAEGCPADQFSRKSVQSRTRLQPLPEMVIARSTKVLGIDRNESCRSVGSRHETAPGTRRSLNQDEGRRPRLADEPGSYGLSISAHEKGIRDNDMESRSLSPGMSSGSGRPAQGMRGEALREGAAGVGALGIRDSEPKGGGPTAPPTEGNPPSTDGEQRPMVARAPCHLAPSPGSLPGGSPGVLRMHVVTWNLAQGDGIADGALTRTGALPDLLLCRDDSPGLVVVGTQETSRWDELSQAFQAQLGTGCHLLTATRAGALGLWLYCSSTLRPLVRELRTSSHLLGVREVVNRATKGGVGASIRLRGGMSVLLINSHLPAGDGKATERNGAYHRIKQALFADLAAERRAKNATNAHDVSVWMGDLNYRVRSNRSAADRALALGMPEVLLGNDQLHQEQRHRRAYVHFREAPVAFPPTYKYDMGTHVYDTSKKSRVPSWTDRILYKPALSITHEQITVNRYTSVQDVTVSDHKPVVMTMDVAVESWEKDWRAQAGMAEDRVIVMRGLGCCIR